MKKEMIFFLTISSMSIINASMNNNDRVHSKRANQVVACCPRTFAVPPCERCAGIYARSSVENKPSHVPLPLSASREKERARLPR